MNQDMLGYGIAAVMPLAVATGLFVSLCTIQQPDGTIGPSGQPSNTFVSVSGLVNIACMDAPLAPTTLSATEIKALAEIEAAGLRHVALDGFYSQIITGWRQGWQAVVDGVAYDILGAETDSQETQTRLKLQLATL